MSRVRPDGLRHGEAVHEVLHDVAHRDRLRLRRDPARGDHDRQPLHEVAQDLEGGRARADDHGRAQDGHRRPPRGEDLLDLAPRGEVLGEARAQLAQAAQVHDALEARVLGRAGEGPGHGPVALGVLVAGRDHRVDEVEGGPAALQGPPQGGDVGRVAGHDLDARVARPGPPVELARLAGEAADAVAGLEQARDEPAPDVAGGAGDEDGPRPRESPCLTVARPLLAGGAAAAGGDRAGSFRALTDPGGPRSWLLHTVSTPATSAVSWRPC